MCSDGSCFGYRVRFCGSVVDELLFCFGHPVRFRGSLPRRAVARRPSGSVVHIKNYYHR